MCRVLGHLVLFARVYIYYRVIATWQTRKRLWKAFPVTMPSFSCYVKTDSIVVVFLSRYDSATAKGDHTARPKTSPALYHQYPVPTAPALQQPDEPVAIWSSGSDANGDYVRLQRGGAPMGASFEASDNYDHMPMGPNDDVYSTLQREERKRQVVDNIYNSCTISSEG
ncbi:hypothetical protein BaRGS_00020983 [Batillaria attramentaria]|uniref:Uncharacterized protein n=1 Tax=Batillaria attramentaria TaxID=370345 RepID=A0ABD0KL43_9CAEN